jgi:FkbM family methyltransferase
MKHGPLRLNRCFFYNLGTASKERVRALVQGLFGALGYRLIRLPDRDASGGVDYFVQLTDYHAYYHGVDFLCPRDSFLGQWVLSGKTWDPNLLPLIERFSHGQSDFAICEVGSNIGASIVPVMARFPNYHYILVEASPQFIRYLHYNTRPFAGNGVEVHNVLLSDNVGGCETLVENRTTGGRTRQGPYGVDREYHLYSTTLDRLAGDRRVDFLKIDTDGFEYPILRGAQSLITRCHPYLLVEFTPGFLREGGEDPRQFLEWLAGLGYSRLEVYDNLGAPLGTLSPEETLRVAESRPNDVDYVDILLIPDRK